MISQLAVRRLCAGICVGIVCVGWRVCHVSVDIGGEGETIGEGLLSHVHIILSSVGCSVRHAVVCWCTSCIVWVDVMEGGFDRMSRIYLLGVFLLRQSIGLEMLFGVEDWESPLHTLILLIPDVRIEGGNKKPQRNPLELQDNGFVDLFSLISCLPTISFSLETWSPG